MHSEAATAAVDRPLDTAGPPTPPRDREAFRRRLLAEIPSWYVPWVHMVVPSTVGIGGIVLALWLLEDLRPVELWTVPAVYLFANAFEWWIHREALHRRHPLAPPLYAQHTPRHHMLYTTGAMGMRDPREMRLILIPGYGLFLMFVTTIPLVATMWWLGYRNVGLLYAATAIGYSVTYEWLHLSYHLPETHPVARLRVIRALRRHHAIHHDPKLMQRWNLNVTVPLMDTVMRTSVRAHPELDR